MKNLNKWLTPVNTVLIILVFIVSLAGNSAITSPTEERSAGQTRISGMIIGDSGLTVNGTATFATTTTVVSSDGFTAGGGVAPSNVATGTELIVYTHTGSPAMCASIDAIFYADSTGDGAPSLRISVGLATDVDLLATTTIATTTDTIKAAITLRSVINAGDTISIYLADGEGAGNELASTTHFADWDIEFQMDCFTIGG